MQHVNRWQFLSKPEAKTSANRWGDPLRSLPVTFTDPPEDGEADDAEEGEEEEAEESDAEVDDEDDDTAPPSKKPATSMKK